MKSRAQTVKSYESEAIQEMFQSAYTVVCTKSTNQ